MAAKLAALFLLIVGAKLCLLSAYSTPLPFYDQWGVEGRDLVQRTLHGTLDWHHFFVPHNRHRILWTRLLVLGLFRANGQWDTQVEMIVAAGLHAFCAVALGAMLIRRLGRADEDRILWCLAFLFLLPFGWENTLSGGFQSQYYFLILFSVVTIWGLGSHRPWSGPWWLGMVAGVLAWFSVASGWFGAAAVAAWAAFRWWRQESGRRDQRITLAAATLLIVGGTSLLVGPSDADRGFQAKSLGEFFWKFCGLLGWPNLTPWAVVVAYAPVGWTLWRCLRRGRSEPTRTENFLVPLAGWVVLQTAALAYARNHYRALDVSRYMDVQCLGTLANFACLLGLARDLPRGSGSHARRALRILQGVWAMSTMFGLYRLTDRNFRGEMPFMASTNAHEERTVAAFLAQPDLQVFVGKEWADFRSEPSSLATDVLMDPAVRAVMPTVVQPTLPLREDHLSGKVYRLNAEQGHSIGADGPGWLLASLPAGQAPSVFCGQTMNTVLPRLKFQGRGAVGTGAQLGLIGERSGHVTPLLPDTGTSGLWTAVIEPPAEPFHLLARVEPDQPGVLAFFEPQEAGRLTIWVEPLFHSAIGWLFAGALLWMGAAACRKQTASPLPAGEPATLDRTVWPPAEPALALPIVRV